MQLEEFYDYKNLLMEQLCCDPEVVRVVTDNDEAAVPNHDLPYYQFFPFEYVPETVNDAKTFICFDVDIVSVPNKTMYIPVIYVWVFAHKSRLRAKEGGCTLDKMAAAVNRLLNGNRYYGLGELKLDSVRRFTPVTDYLGRVLTFYTKDFNRKWTKPDIPVNRKEGI